MNIDKLKQIKTIISHDHCADGIASAIIVRDVLPNAEVKFMQYGTKELKELQPSEGMLFVDFSPPADRVKEFVEAGAMCLDHHKTAREVVEAFGDNGVFGDEKTEPGVCGAVLAFRHVWSRMTVDSLWRDKTGIGHFAILAGVRDTWQKQDPDWREACSQKEMLLFYNDWLDIKFNQTILAERMTVGRLILEKWERDVAEAVKSAYRFSVAGIRVACIQGISFSSDAAELIGEDVDLVAAFSYKTENNVPKLIWSTRSHTNFDCSDFAKSFGGGGHIKAAGFSVSVEDAATPYQDLTRRLRVWMDET